MATFTRSEVTTTVVEFRVPAAPGLGAPWAEVEKAAGAAFREMRGDPVYDRTLTVRPGDNEIIVTYEKVR